MIITNIATMPWITMAKRATASAPSQAFLLGEHAVLYGSSALALSIDRRAYSTAQPIEDGEILIESELGRYREKKGKVLMYNDDLAKLAEGLRILLNKYDIRSGVSLEIRSEVPIGSGMASSASVSAAISKSIDALFELEMSSQDLLEAVYIFERIRHGKASKTRPACTVLGGAIWVEWFEEDMEAVSLGYKEVPLAIACTGKPSPTKVMIDSVSGLRRLVPSIHDNLIRSISEVVMRGKSALEEGNLKVLGSLMNINQGLLYSLGVSSWEIERIVWEARREGALGAKLSGAGGGGCVVILHERPHEILKKVSAPLIFPATVAREGARVESVT